MAFVADMRRFQRTQYVGEITCTVNVLEFREFHRLLLKCKTADISKKGLGICTDYPLEPGHVISFEDISGHNAGIVRWSRNAENSYRAGIEFV